MIALREVASLLLIDDPVENPIVCHNHAAANEMDRYTPIPEFTDVTLKHPVDVQGVHVPAGAHGVVMATYADGWAYEVEFEEPQHVVLTLKGEGIQA